MAASSTAWSRTGRSPASRCPTKTIEDLAQSHRSIEPTITPEIEVVPLGDGRMSVDILSVTRSHRRPHTFKGVAYKRGGNTTIALTREQYNELLFEAFHATQRWENEPAPDSTVGDLDRMEIARTIEAAIQSGASRIPGHGTLWTWLEDLGYYPTAA